MQDIKKSGIYKVSNIINNKMYIGSAAGKHGIYQRFCDHKKHLRKGTHHNIYLQRSWNKYGEDNFTFEIIETCKKEECIEKEQLYIDTLMPEYNICKTAGNTSGINSEDFMSKEAILKKRKRQSINISRALTGKSKTKTHAVKCGAKYFIAYEAINTIKRKRGQAAEYVRGKYIGRWLKRSDCSVELNIDDKFIRRCLQGKRPQTHGYIFEFEVV